MIIVKNPTLQKYVTLLLKQFKNTYRESTIAGYTSCLNAVAFEIDAKYTFEELRHSDIVEIVVGWQETYKNKTIKNRMTAMNKLTALATEDGYFPKNPCEKVVSLKPDTQLEEKKPFSQEEYQKLEDTPTDRPVSKALALLGRLTGLRIQELIALCWSDIDFKARKIHVRRSRTKEQFNLPKTKQSERCIDMIDETKELLTEVFTKTGNTSPTLIKVRDVSKIAHIDHEFCPVFVDDVTELPFEDSKDYAQRFFTQFLKDAGLDHRGPSQLRHTFASITLSNGVPVKLVSTIMGHADASITEKHYAKWIPISDSHTRTQLSAAFSLGTKPRTCKNFHLDKFIPNSFKIHLLSLCHRVTNFLTN
ncbi:tyrosine-type recombinase/integrase [Vibrio breoganii]|uniref:tyrosine-type recombinase/integrase n=1 Tax=Vibrio breoganii TaxID=553239 RepID=UPI000C82F202|nr:site-specific integrase [Vibrio breoganii]PMG98504.1 hypothetical protein BCU79_04150 [Vibrio breoganii]PMJ46652.1 hypothetical protein BCU21_09715 [Vibrio breoganii]PMK60514.1 hypothetical protein BCT97_05350 [Vibrio breoganii]PMM89649.1 hypothetical protein BCT44_16770 [Vibrio breoganii]PMO27492.1 hypothetical protein BCT14_11855 [Vibrio breoganii]